METIISIDQQLDRVTVTHKGNATVCIDNSRLLSTIDNIQPEDGTVKIAYDNRRLVACLAAHYIEETLYARRVRVEHVDITDL